MKKKCTKCGGIKDETEFLWKNAKHKQRTTVCRTCANVYKKQWRQKNPRREDKAVWQRRTHLKYTFGMTVEQYDAMVLIQKNTCAICGKPEVSATRRTSSRLTVDHDHRTGKIRALLCRKCNSMLGMADDNPVRLRKAAVYLEYHS